jgi:hypothetical protein
MKKHKIFLKTLTVASIGLSLSMINTSCSSSVSKEIIDNLVNRGDGSKFTNNGGASSKLGTVDDTNLKEAIRSALYDKNSTAQFKKAVANALLYK